MTSKSEQLREMQLIFFWVKYRHYSNPNAFRLIEGSLQDFEYFKNQAYSWDLIADNELLPPDGFFTSKTDATDFAEDNGMTYLDGSTHFDAYKSDSGESSTNRIRW